MEDPGYAYFHCDLLDRVVLTIITWRWIASYRYAWTTFVERHICEGESFWHWIKVQTRFWKCDMHVVIIIESRTIVLSILAFQPKLVPIFFHHGFH
jgi:hypothetical protein